MSRPRRTLAGVAAAALVAGALALSASPAGAATVDLTYSLGPGDVTIDAGACTPNPGAQRYADLGVVLVTQSGTYSFQDVDTIDALDGLGYQDATLWIDVAGTCRQLNFAVTSLDLVADVPYRVVATSAAPGVTGAFGYRVSGPGVASFLEDDPASYCASGFVPAPYTAIYGTKKAERIVGTANHDVILAGAGDDRIDGGTGHDVLCGGAGSDEVVGGLGDDTLVGGDGADRLVGESGDDVLYGNDGADRLEGGDGYDVLHGGVGADRLDGGPSYDYGYDFDKSSSFTGVEYVVSGPR